MPYINTIDIHGTTYHLKNLTDGDYVVDLPELNKNDIFVLRGDVVDNLSSYQSNKPLSANQGRTLNGKIDNFKSQLDVKDSELGNKISQLRTDMGENDSSTLNAAKTYTDDKSSEALTAANQHTNESCQAINETITSLQDTVNDNKKSLDEDIAELTYKREYQRRITQVYRADKKQKEKMKKEFQIWKDKAREQLKLYRGNKISKEEFGNWIEQNK